MEDGGCGDRRARRTSVVGRTGVLEAVTSGGCLPPFHARVWPSNEHGGPASVTCVCIYAVCHGCSLSTGSFVLLSCFKGRNIVGPIPGIGCLLSALLCRGWPALQASNRSSADAKTGLISFLGNLLVRFDLTSICLCFVVSHVSFLPRWSGRAEYRFNGAAVLHPRLNARFLCCRGGSVDDRGRWRDRLDADLGTAGEDGGEPLADAASGFLSAHMSLPLLSPSSFIRFSPFTITNPDTDIFFFVFAA
jgi:hypothetical protein